MRLQYHSAVTLILTEPQTQSERDTKKVDNYITMLPDALGPTLNKFKVLILRYLLSTVWIL